MTTLAVFSHFDPDGLVSPYARRYVRELAGAVDRTVVVSTAPLGPTERAELEDVAELVVRENVGYDFGSWKAGLDRVGDWTGYDRVVLANDSVVGPLRPMEEILAAGPCESADFWGMTISQELTPHVQSWFLVFERGALDSAALTEFWRTMTPISQRSQVILTYELGLSRTLLGAGLRGGSFLNPSREQITRAYRRYDTALRADPALAAWARQAGGAASEGQWRQVRAQRPPWNPCLVFWDAALDGGLPFVKWELLRDDPYRFGRDQVLSRLERAFPEEFAGVREHLDRVGSRRPVR
jgi:rhamnosyltransferase